MSRFFSEKYAGLTPYEPGEQPQDQQYVKLNTNESPFATSPKAVSKAAKAAERLQLYSDPDVRILTKKLADKCSRRTDRMRPSTLRSWPFAMKMYRRYFRM